MHQIKHSARLGIILSLAAVFVPSAVSCRSVHTPEYQTVQSVENNQELTRSTDHRSENVSESQWASSQDQADDRWPHRWPSHHASRGIIIDLDPSEPLTPKHHSRDHHPRTTPSDYEDAQQLARNLNFADEFKFRPEGPGSYVFVPKHTPGKASNSNTQSNSNNTDSSKPNSDQPDLAFKFVSATLAPDSDVNPQLPNKPSDPLKGYALELSPIDESELNDLVAQANEQSDTHSNALSTHSTQRSDQEDHVILQRTWFTYRDPSKHWRKKQLEDQTSKEQSTSDQQSQQDLASTAKGTVVLLPGMFGTPELIVESCETFWTLSGYSVLQMRSQPSRFTEHEMIRTAPGLAVLQADKLAHMNDERVSEGAYATHAALNHLFTKRPSLKDKPVILLGMSGGAMMLPTVYAYAPELYDAAVLIAGGADFVRIAIRSTYKSWIDAIVFDFDPSPSTLGKISDSQLDNLSKDYLRKSKLDAFHTAKDMNNIPVLMLHASNDQAVPASSGDLLHAQLGKPERWTYPIGHELIFVWLPTQMQKMNAWIDKHVHQPKSKTTPKAE